MSAGFIEFIAILTSLGGFGISDNPSAPTAAQVARYAVADADLVIHVDVAALVPGNYRALRALPNAKEIRHQPAARTAVDEFVRTVEDTREKVKTTIGLDLVTDVTSATMWVVFPESGKPDVLIEGRGTFSPQLPSKIAAQMGGAVGDIDGHPTVTSPEDDDVMIAVVGSSLLLGDPSLVKARASRSWRAGKPRARSTSARFGQMLDRRPFLVVASSPSRVAAAQWARDIDRDGQFLADAVTSHEFAALVLAKDGVSWTWTDRTRKGYARAVMASQGALELMRASHLGGRGMARLMLAAVESYVGQAPEIAAIVKHRDEILALVEDMTGDGTFKAVVTENARSRTVTVDARGRKLSDVLPLAGLGPLLGAAVWMGLSEGVVGEDKLEEVRPADTAQSGRGGLLIRDTYRQVKERHDQDEKRDGGERDERNKGDGGERRRR